MAIIGGEGVIFMEWGELTYFLKNHYFIFVLTNLLLIIFHIMVKIRRQKNNFIIIKIEQGNYMEINPTEFFLKKEEYEQQKENLNNLLLYIDNIENYDLVIKNKNKEEQIPSRRKEEITTDKIVTTDTTDIIGTTNKNDNDIIKILNYKNISPFISQEQLSLKSFFGGSNISGSDIGGSGGNVTFSVNKRFDNPNPSSEIFRDLFSGSIPFFDKFLGIADQLLQNNIVASSSSVTPIILDKELLKLERHLPNEKNGGNRQSVIELTEGKKGISDILEGFLKLGENMTKEYNVNNNSEDTDDLHEKHPDENSVDETNIEDDDINSEIIDVLAKKD